ncbi:6-O-methylguanine DNA methyltransferase [Mrakia frigida]|uniref:methylated-DNA--protein-cysteine methyltransferase n=1 Tax=Mrakia frigida TaxID=29902 RepID=UPI003FCBF582
MKIPSSLSPKTPRVIPYTLPPSLPGSLASRDPSTVDFPSTLSSRQSYLNPATSKPLTPFQWKVYDLVIKLPRGRTTTYGAIAAHLQTSPRAVGTALSNNPFCPKVPCHRVVAKGGEMGGFLKEKSKGLLVDQKVQMLKEEGVELVAGKLAGTWVVKGDADGLGEWIWG